MFSVLYVDDEPDLLDIGRLFLESTGDFSVSTDTRAAHALATIEGGAYDAVISDYQMPEMDGITFLQEVRTRFGDLPFILFTGRGREEIAIQALNTGADFYLQKGGDPASQFAELAHKLRQAIGKRRAEEALAESEARFRNLAESTLDTIMLFDRNLRHLYVNPIVERQTGIPAEKFMGRTHAELGFPPELVAFLERALREAIGTAKTCRYEFQLPAGMWVDWMLVPVRDPKGSVVQIIASARDITERKKTETSLREAYERITAAEEELRGQYEELAKSERQIRQSEEEYRRLTDKLPIPVCVAVDSGEITYINDRFTQMFGYAREDIPTLSEWWVLAYPDEKYRREVLETWMSAVDRAKDDGTDIPPLVYQVTCKDGSVRQVEISGIPFERRFLATFIDLTGRPWSGIAPRDRRPGPDGLH